MNIAALDTPALAADLDVLERNINGMATLCDQIGIPLRVHTIPKHIRCQKSLNCRSLPVPKALPARN